MPLAEPFTIARGTQTDATTVLVEITDEAGMTGIGAAAPAAHYGETPATVAAVLPELLAVVEDVGDPHAIASIDARMKGVVRDNPAARCAVAIALSELGAKRLGVPLYRLWGLDPKAAPQTSFTVGIGTTARMRERAAEAVAAGYSTLKVKLGGDRGTDRGRGRGQGQGQAQDQGQGQGQAQDQGHDKDRDHEIVSSIREAAPNATIRVDANEAWTPRETVEKSAWLADLGVEFIEQPVAASDPAGIRFAYERSALPIAADESCLTAADVPTIADSCDIVNLKLMKTGGLEETRRAIATAHAHGLEVMLGCMIESNASIAAAAHLAPAVEYADLDGSLLLANDPYTGVDLTGGPISLSSLERPGTGASRHTAE